MKNKITLVQRIITKKIADLDRLRRMVAFVSQYNRIKFGDAVPQQFVDAQNAIESLIPSDARMESYAQFEVSSHPSVEYMMTKAIKRTRSNAIRSQLSEIQQLNLFEPAELSDLSSTDSGESGAHVVPDVSGPKPKKLKSDNSP